MEVTLAGLKKGQKGVVTKIKARGAFNRRIRDMGVSPGTEIFIEGIAPLGDPLNIKAKGFSSAIRNNEAEQIYVKVL